MPRMSNPACALAMCRTEYQGTGNGLIDSVGPEWFETGTYGEVMRMIRAGKCDEEITDRFPRWKGDVLAVCRKAANGTLANLSVYGGNTDPEVRNRISTNRRKRWAVYEEKQAEAARLTREGRLSERAIARELGISHSTIRRWKENGDI